MVVVRSHTYHAKSVWWDQSHVVARGSHDRRHAAQGGISACDDFEARVAKGGTLSLEWSKVVINSIQDDEDVLVPINHTLITG